MVFKSGPGGPPWDYSGFDIQVTDRWRGKIVNYFMLWLKAFIYSSRFSCKEAKCPPRLRGPKQF